MKGQVELSLGGVSEYQSDNTRVELLPAYYIQPKCYYHERVHKFSRHLSTGLQRLVLEILQNTDLSPFCFLIHHLPHTEKSRGPILAQCAT
jgi:hypothetical protein